VNGDRFSLVMETEIIPVLIASIAKAQKLGVRRMKEDRGKREQTVKGRKREKGRGKGYSAAAKNLGFSHILIPYYPAGGGWAPFRCWVDYPNRVVVGGNS